MHACTLLRLTIVVTGLTHAVCRPGYIGVICTHLNLCDAVDFAVQKTTQVRRRSTSLSFVIVHNGAHTLCEKRQNAVYSELACHARKSCYRQQKASPLSGACHPADDGVHEQQCVFDEPKSLYMC